MESTVITRLCPLLPSPSKSRPPSSSPLAGARRIASISFSSGSVCGVLRPRGGVTSSVTAAAAALGEAAGPESEAILLSVQGMMCDGCAASVKRILESQNSKEWMIERRDKLILEARDKLLGLSDPLAELKMIDALQLLGVSYHFKVDIDSKLQKLSTHKFDNENLLGISLQFRLLRQERHHISHARGYFCYS